MRSIWTARALVQMTLLFCALSGEMMVQGVQPAKSKRRRFPASLRLVQVMVKNSRHYASTGGWRFDRIINGQPVDLAQHQTCFACQES